MFAKMNMSLLGLAAAALTTGVLLFTHDASADLFSQCGVKSGSTRFLDFETNKCGWVFDANRDWSVFSGNWTNRADQFGNDGNTSSNCLYDGVACGGNSVFLPRGFAVTWPNTVSSNRWTTSSSCVTSC